MARPESPRLSTETLEAPKLELLVEREIAPEAVIVYCAWGRPVGNEELLEDYISSSGITDGEEINRAETLVYGTGISTRHITERPGTIFENREIVADEMVAIGTELTRMALKGEKADIIYFTSSVPPDKFRFNDERNWGKRIARESGNPEAEINLLYLACGGSGTAFLDALKRPELADKRIVITSVESISSGLRYPPQTQKELTAVSIFGNGASSFSFIPNQFELFFGVTKIIPDEKGVIRCPKLYELPDESLRRKPPPWYEADGVSPDIFAYTDHEVAMMLPAPKGNPNYVEMDEFATAKFFLKNLPEIMVEVIKKSGVEVERMLSHQPSRPVLLGSSRSINRGLKEFGHREIESRWFLDKVGMANASSAMTQVAMAEGLEGNDPVAIASFGVGADFTGMVVRVKP